MEEATKFHHLHQQENAGELTMNLIKPLTLIDNEKSQYKSEMLHESLCHGEFNHDEYIYYGYSA